MTDTQSQNTPSQDTPAVQSRKWTVDVARLDRLVSRSLFFLCAAGLATLWLLSSPLAVRRPAWVAAAVVYAAGKAVVLVAALIHRWPAWPAVLAEVLAVGLVAAVVWTGARESIYVVIVAALLLSAGLWRARTASSGEENP